MNQGKVLALVGLVAALAAVAFFWSAGSSSSDDGDLRASRRRALQDRAAETGAPGERRRAGLRARAESRGDAPRANERAARDDSGSSRRRLPGEMGGRRNPGSGPGAGSAPGGGRMAGTRREPGAGIARPPVNREDESRKQPDLPEATGLAPGADAEEQAIVEPPTEPIREVAFEGGDRLFDTGVPMEVKDAGRISPDGGMVSFWIQPEWAHNSEDSADLMRLGETGLQIVKEGSFLRFQYTDANGNEQGGDADVSQWQDGEWHHVIASWTGEAMTFYLDGGQAFANQGITRPPAQSDPRLFVGSAFPEGEGIALAQMSHLTVINRTASSEEVRKMFDAGGPTRK